MVSHSALASGTGADGDNDDDEEDDDAETEREEDDFAAEVRARFAAASGALFDDAAAATSV